MPRKGTELDRLDANAEDCGPTQEPAACSRTPGRNQENRGTVWRHVVHDRGPEIIFPFPNNDEDQLGRGFAAADNLDAWRALRQWSVILLGNVEVYKAASISGDPDPLENDLPMICFSLSSDDW